MRKDIVLKPRSLGVSTLTYERIKEIIGMDAKTKLWELVREIYQTQERNIVLRYPWVLVRVLPRPTSSPSGLIITPETQQKVNEEGVVLGVYRPFEKISFEYRDDGLGGEEIPVRENIECGVQVGDHVVFPHYEGVPIWYLDDKQYRVIKEDTIFCVLDYGQKIWEAVEECDGDIDELFKYFYVIPKEIRSRTTSGV